jgi:hypothetical protein
MDIDHLKRLVDAVIEEGERTNADGPAQAALESYLHELCVPTPRDPSIGKVHGMLIAKLRAVAGILRNPPPDALWQLFSEISEIPISAGEIEAAAVELSYLTAVCDGWKQIAQEMLRAAFDNPDLDFEVPPLELSSYQGDFAPRLHQWWADVTRQHDERRRAHQDPITARLEWVEEPLTPGEFRAPAPLRLIAGEAIQPGEILTIGKDGYARRAR